MEACYITGHRNPDMDSVCSAYAYSVLLNTVFRNGEIKYVPVRLGPVSDSVKKVFEELSIPLPDVLKDVRCKVSDVMRRGSLSLKSDDPIYELVLLYNKAHPSVVPIEKDGDVIGLISVDDINRFFLKENHKERPNYIIREENIQKVVGGHFYKRGEQKTFQNSIIVGAMEYDVFVKRAEKCPTKPFLVVGNRKRHIEYAVEHDFPGIILTGVDDIESLGIDFSSYKGLVYLSSEDTAETIRLLRLATPIREVMAEDGGPKLMLSTPYDEAKNTLRDSSYRGLSIYEGDKWKGFVTRRCFLERPRKKVILVDHNELEQSVPGLEEAEIIGIVDHHRLDAPKLARPISIISEPIGSTCTIVYQQFIKYGVGMDKSTAKVLLSGVIADTVMLKSPTTTRDDIEAAFSLQSLAEVSSIEDYGRSLFSSSLRLRNADPEKIILQDFKKYSEKGISFAIAQVEVPSLDEVEDIFAAYRDKLMEIRDKNGLSWAMLLLTDVFKENSMLITTGLDCEYRFVYEKERDGLYYLPGVLSRKKQLLPEVLRILED